MEKIKLMVADDNLDVCGMFVEFFSNQNAIVVTGEAHNGLELIKLMEKDLPDVILLDMVMPQMDGFAVLEYLHKQNLPNRPSVIALTALNRDDFIMRTISLGVEYYMLKPFDMNVLYQRVLEAAARRAQPRPEVRSTPFPITPTKSVDERITSVFLTIGIPAHIKGYQFLREGVKMVLETPDMINRITKELYPGIARRFNTTASKVERAIRHAIEVAWGRGRIEVLNQVFGTNVCSLDAKPTNGEFIALVADKLSLERSA